MTPLRLNMQAFGPYGGQAEVDFERLRAVGLFVVSGPTGAGKTSIFDAMAYALYNDLPGERGGFREIRSDHADPAVLCQVTFEFEADGDRWRVTRVPTQERAKKRGVGLATENAAAALDRWNGTGWDPVETSVNAVTTRCTELVGLESKQFQRVMLLPQGQFQQVLKANSKDRRDLLRTLFSSGLYESIEAELKERAKEAEETLGELARSVGADQAAAAASYADALDALGVAEPDVVEPDVAEPGVEGPLVLADGASLEEIERAASRLRAGKLRTMIDAQGALDDTATSLRDDLNRAQHQELQRKRHGELLLQRAALAEVSDAMVADEVRVENARQARPIVDQQAELGRQQRVSTNAQADAGREADKLHEIGATLGFEADLLGQDDLEAARNWALSIEQTAQRAIEQLERAARLRSLAAEADLAATEAAAQTADLAEKQALLVERQAQLKHRHDHLVRLVDSLPQRQAELAAAIAQQERRATLLQLDQQLTELAAEDGLVARDLAEVEGQVLANTEQAEGLDQRVGQLSERLRSADLVEAKLRDRKRLDEAQQRHSAATEAYGTARDNADRVLREFESAASPRLAGALVAGQPCSVCGSTVHPDPAVDDGAGDGIVDLSAVEQAQTELTAAASAMSEANEQCSTLLDLLGDDATTALEDLQTAAAAATEHVADSRAAEQELISNRAERNRLDQRSTELAARRTELALQREALGAEHARADGALGDAATQSLDQLDAAVQVANQRASEAEQAGVDSASLEAELGEISDINTLVASQLAAAEQQRIEAVKARDLHLGEAEVVAAKVAGSEASYRTDLTSAHRFLEGVERLGRAWRSAAEAKVRVEAVKAQQQSSLADSTFESLGHAVAASLDVDVAETLGAAVQKWKSDLTAVDSAIAEIERTPLPDIAPDTAVLQRRVDESARLATVNQERLTKAHLHLDQLATTVDRGRASEAAVRDRQVAAQRVKELADICVGNGPLRRSLESWVLAAHLRDVVALANQHLAPMSGDRYELMVAESTDDRRSQSGLELTVLDARSGKPRPVASLSGGETFQASLALALGLADVVSANRGGIQIDALFVDEGFGSLDAESLDHAIDVLDRLRSRGALVGVITHVEALKRALQVGIEVERHPDGSGSVLRQLI